MNVKHTLTRADNITSQVLLFIATFLLAIYSWISLEPRNISQFLPHLHEVIRPALGDRYQLKAEQLWLRAGGFEAPLSLQLRHVTLHDAKEVKELAIQQLALRPAYRHLLRGQLAVDAITLQGVKVELDMAPLLAEGKAESADHLRHNTNHSLESETVNSSPESRQNLLVNDPAKLTADLEQHWINYAPYLKRITLLDVEIELQHSAKNLRHFLTIPKIRFLKTPTNGGELFLDATLAGYREPGEASGKLNLQARYQRNAQALSVRLALQDLQLHNYADWISLPPQIAAFSLPLSGEIAGDYLLAERRLKPISYQLRSPEINLTLPESLHTPLPIRQFSAKGTANHETATLTIEQADFQIEETHFAIKQLSVQDTGGDAPLISGHFALEHSHLDFLLKYWPNRVASEAYQWIEANLMAATIPTANFTFALDEAAYAAEKLPESAVQGSIAIEGATVYFLPELPPATKVQGMLSLAGQSFTAKIDDAQGLDGTRFARQGTLHITDLMSDNLLITIDAPLTTTAQDAVKFIQKTAYKLKSDALTYAKTVKSDVDLQLKLEIIDHISPKPDEVDFSAEGSAQNLRADLSGQQLKLAGKISQFYADSRRVDLQSVGTLNGQPYDSSLKYTPETGLNVDFKGSIPIAALQPYLPASVDEIATFKGSIGVKKFTYTMPKARSSTFNAALDLTPMDYTYTGTGFVKSKGEPASLTVKGGTQQNLLTLSTLELKDPFGEVSATLVVDIPKARVNTAKLNKFNYINSQFNAEYSLKSGTHYATMKGFQLDLSIFDYQKRGATLPQWLLDPPAHSLDVEIFRMLTKDGGIYDNLILQSKGQNARIDAMNLGFKAKDTFLEASIQPQADGTRIFKAISPNFGALPRSSDITKIERGALEIKGEFLENVPNPGVKGLVTLKNVQITDAPLLTRILTLATLTGILDAMSGDGLLVQELKIPYYFHDGQLYLRKAKAVGPSIGLTASGKINLVENKLDLEGKIIPVKLLDTLITKIPLVGQVYNFLTSGEGLVAFSYDVKGDFENTKTSVNPFTALTPGFLRDIFIEDNFDFDPAQLESKPPAPAKPVTNP